MDSLTRFAMAQREIALAIGEPPGDQGLSAVGVRAAAAARRARRQRRRGGGSITAFYTVLTEGDDPQDPIADAARAILDGHIVLSRSLAEQGHYPGDRRRGLDQPRDARARLERATANACGASSSCTRATSATAT